MITSDWYDEAQTIIMMRFSGSLILGEVADAGKSCYELSQQTQGRFDIIADLGQAGYTPPVGILWHWIQQSQSHHLTYPNWGLAVVVAENPLFLVYFEEGIKNVQPKYGQIVTNKHIYDELLDTSHKLQ
jgi:hypothetical protein